MSGKSNGSANNSAAPVAASPTSRFWSDTARVASGTAATVGIITLAITSLIHMGNLSEKGEMMAVATTTASAASASLVCLFRWLFRDDSQEREPLVNQTAPGMGIGASSAV